MKNHSKAHCFVKELKEQFDKYDISYSMVNNAAKYLSKIENDSIIIIFNDESVSTDENLKSCYIWLRTKKRPYIRLLWIRKQESR